MGAGGINGELRDHSEQVNAILRTHFNVANANSQTSSSSASSNSVPAEHPSTSTFNFPEDAFEDMACFNCSSNFSIFRRKVLACVNRLIIASEDLLLFLLCVKIVIDPLGKPVSSLVTTLFRAFKKVMCTLCLIFQFDYPRKPLWQIKGSSSLCRPSIFLIYSVLNKLLYLSNW